MCGSLLAVPYLLASNYKYRLALRFGLRKGLCSIKNILREESDPEAAGSKYVPITFCSAGRAVSFSAGSDIRTTPIYMTIRNKNIPQVRP